MATRSNKALRRQKKAQAYLSGTSAALGIGALGAMGVKSGAGKLVRAGSRSGVLRRPVPVDNVRRGADKAMSGLTVGSVGVGGVSGANFASIQNQEAKRIRKSEGIGMDFGLSSVRQGEVSKAMTPEQRKINRSNRKIESEYEQKYGGRGMAAGALAGAGAGIALANSRSLSYGARAGVRLARRGDGLKASVKGANLMRKETVRRTRRPDNWTWGMVGGLTGAAAGGPKGANYGNKKAKKDPRYQAIGKAFDAERSRRRRLDVYSHGAAAAGGAAALVGGRQLASGIKETKGAKTLPKFKSGLKATGKGAAITAGAAGAGIGAMKIQRFKRRNGDTYRPRYTGL